MHPLTKSDRMHHLGGPNVARRAPQAESWGGPRHHTNTRICTDVIHSGQRLAVKLRLAPLDILGKIRVAGSRSKDTVPEPESRV
jgi:hypothetical protein